MYLEIVTPEASLASGEVESVSVPGVNGSFQMFNNHAAIVSLLKAGKVKFSGDLEFTEGFEDRFTKEDGKWTIEISSGAMEMKDNKVIVLAD